MEYEYRQLNDYKGFTITKSYLTDYNGKILKNTIVYDAFDKNDALLDAKKDLKELKKVIDNYLN